jgi:hypothetical protein
MIDKNFTVDENVAQTFEDLKRIFGVKTDAEVLARALGLAKVASDVAADDMVVTLAGARGEQKIVLDR